MGSYNMRHEKSACHIAVGKRCRGEVRNRTNLGRSVAYCLPLILLAACQSQPKVDWESVYYEEGKLAGAMSMTSVVGGR